MASLMKAMEAKSDQLNFVDLGAGGERVLYVEKVVTIDAPQQPVSIYYDGCNNKPWKPSKGMIRVLAAAYGDDDQGIIGKSILVYGEASVKWAGEETGGIRIKALSDINKSGIDIFIAENRQKRRKKHFDYLDTLTKITETDQSWIDAIKLDASALEQIEDPTYKKHIKSILDNHKTI